MHHRRLPYSRYKRPQSTVLLLLKIPSPAITLATPSVTLNWTGNTYDDYPNGTTETLDTGLILDPLENKTYYRNYVVTTADVTRGYVLNNFRVVGKDGSVDDTSGVVEMLANHQNSTSLRNLRAVLTSVSAGRRAWML